MNWTLLISYVIGSIIGGIIGLIILDHRYRRDKDHW